MKRASAAAGIAAATAVALVVILPRDKPIPASARPESVAAAQTVTAPQARELLAAGALLVDVREPEELAESGKLAGAVNAPLTRIKQGLLPGEVQAAQGRAVILYCRSGRRSAEAGAILRGRGFGEVYNLGGFDDAVRAGLPAA